MMTHLLERFSVGLFEVTLFEATSRLGGKVLTQRFDTIPAIYEAGVAELYDYSEIGLDPLKTLVQYLGLKAVPMDGHAVVLGDEILRNEHDFHRRFGLPAFRALNEFHKTCAALYSRSDYYEGHVAPPLGASDVSRSARQNSRRERVAIYRGRCAQRYGNRAASDQRPQRVEECPD